VENAAPWFCARKNDAEVVENARPWFCERKYSDDVVAQRDWVDSKYTAEVVEKKLFTDFQ
jgi:hypothetical protein